MKYVLTLISLIWLMNTAGLSQDTVKVYLNGKYEVIENKEKAVFIREAYVKQNKIYHITDKYLDGQMIVEGDYSSLNPWTEDGYFKYYDESAMNCLKNSPLWQPARNGNVIVSQQFVIPVIFILVEKGQEIPPLQIYREPN